MLQLGRTYDEYVIPYIQDATRMPMSSAEVTKAWDFAVAKAAAKVNEEHHKDDNKGEVDRGFTGILAEMAVEKVIGVPYIDWTISTDSRKHAQPDLFKIGVRAGVKCTEWKLGRVLGTGANACREMDQFPTITRNEHYPEIMTFREKNAITICGLASVSTMRAYQDDDLIKNQDMLRRKTGFYGFCEIIPFRTYPELLNKVQKMVCNPPFGGTR